MGNCFFSVLLRRDDNFCLLCVTNTILFCHSTGMPLQLSGLNSYATNEAVTLFVFTHTVPRPIACYTAYALKGRRCRSRVTDRVNAARLNYSDGCCLFIFVITNETQNARFILGGKSLRSVFDGNDDATRQRAALSKGWAKGVCVCVAGVRVRVWCG